METVVTDFTETQVILMMRILSYDAGKRVTISGLAGAIGVNPCTPSWNKVLKYLFSIGALECVEHIATAKIIKINRRMLRDLIDEQVITNKFYDYFNEHHYCLW